MIGKLFVYENIIVSDDRFTVSFVYRVETNDNSYTLTEEIRMPIALPDNPTIDRHLRALHIALGISYYKTFLPPKIDHAYSMEANEATFWNDVFKNGLGEFLYKNNLSAKDIAQFSAQRGNIEPEAVDSVAWQPRVLLGIGGGKDSIVAGELLKELALPVTGFVLATGQNRGQAQAVADVMRVELLGIERKLDPQILELNKVEGAFNGHIPISLIFALSGCLLATARGDKYVVVANEASASIPHVEHEGMEVNHQWSKSLEFERGFQEFVHRYLSEHLVYFSAVRQLTSIAVAKIFAHYPAYLPVFTSDNTHFKIAGNQEGHPRWGLMSAKSLSSYILLAPWIDKTSLDEAFGRNFLDVPELEELFYNLLGKGSETILDCVGTPHELRLSLSIAATKDSFNDSVLMQKAREKSLILNDTEAMLAGALRLSDEHAIPETIQGHLQAKMEEKLR